MEIYYVGIDPSDVRNDRITQHHHDNAAGHSSTNSYVAPIIENKENDDIKLDITQKTQLMDIHQIYNKNNA